MRTSIVFLLTTLLTVVIASKVQAYKTDTHRVISLRAANLSTRYSQFVNDFNADPNEAVQYIMYGSVAEDDEGFLRFVNHFYDPINETGLGLSPTALSWGYSNSANDYSWTKARSYMYQALTGADIRARHENFQKLFRSLGQIIHLVEDMAHPSHTRNDPHASHYEPFGGILAPALNPSHLEDWAQIHTGEVAAFSNLASGPQLAVSFDHPFRTLSSFSNRNFFSDDTIFKKYPQPSADETNFDDFLLFGIGEAAQVFGEDGQTYTVPYIIKTRGAFAGYKLAQVGYFGDHLRVYPEFRHLGFQIDDEVAKENAQILIPQAVGYSAGLLDYFFRARLDAQSTKWAGVKKPMIRITNESNESMNGTFALYYEDKNNKRWQVQDASWNLSIAPAATSGEVSFTAPDDNKEYGKYILVFQGVMGAEGGAVGGKWVTLTPPPYVFIVQERASFGPPAVTDQSGQIGAATAQFRALDSPNQSVEGRFVTYTPIERITVLSASKLIINGQAMLGQTWNIGDTPDPPSTWRIELIPVTVGTVACYDTATPNQIGDLQVDLKGGDRWFQSIWSYGRTMFTSDCGSFNFAGVGSAMEYRGHRDEETPKCTIPYDDKSAILLFKGTLTSDWKIIQVGGLRPEDSFFLQDSGGEERCSAWAYIHDKYVDAENRFREFWTSYNVSPASVAVTVTAEIQRQYDQGILNYLQSIGVQPVYYSIIGQ